MHVVRGISKFTKNLHDLHNLPEKFIKVGANLRMVTNLTHKNQKNPKIVSELLTNAEVPIIRRMGRSGASNDDLLTGIAVLRLTKEIFRMNSKSD